jgi:hypothetical protein
MPVGMGAGVGSGGTASAGHGAAGTGAAAAGAAAAGYASHNSAFSAAQGNKGNKGSYGPNLPFQLKKVIVAAPPLASAATISDPTTSEDVQAGLRRDAAADRNPVTTTDPGPGPAPAAKQFTGSLGDTQSATLKLLGSP